MNFVFRTDASIEIGTGHVMRCLTLADALAAKGARCTFICREHEGNLIELIGRKGHEVHSLSIGQGADTDLAHGSWLGATQAQDAQVCTPLLESLRPEWLVVDHYALDVRWENFLAHHCGQLMVIDDLADRQHTCSALLDQTFGRHPNDYRHLVTDDCTLLCGSSYALLRPEFSTLRSYSLQRRATPKLKHLLINMGGVDKDNVTKQVLDALKGCPLDADCEITVVMGATAPWLTLVEQEAQAMPWPTTVRSGVKNMAQLMADSDLAIGAAGATSWERCCLGLPTVMMILAKNQQHAARLLEKAKAVRILDLGPELQNQLAQFFSEINSSDACLELLRDNASEINDGKGCEQVTDWLMRRTKNE